MRTAKATGTNAGRLVTRSEEWRPGVAVTVKRVGCRSLNRGATWGLFFVLPAVIFFSVFYAYPIAWAGWISLHDYNMLGSSKYIGFDNYERLFRGRQFFESTKASFYYTFG